MLSAIVVCVLQAVAESDNEIGPAMLAARVASVERAVERYELVGEIQVGKFTVELSGDENQTMDWSRLSSATPQYVAAKPFVIERDRTAGTVYYCSEGSATSGPRQEYHVGRRRCVLFHNDPDQVFPTVMLTEGVFGQCRDDAAPRKWDMIWLKPLHGMSISEGLLQTQSAAPTGLLANQQRFRLNGVKGLDGERIVDVSLVCTCKRLDSGNRTSIEGFRLLLAETHDFMPLVVCTTSPALADGKPGSMIDGLATSVIFYDDYRYIAGIPVPHITTAFTMPYRGTVDTVRATLHMLKVNDDASVREEVEIPVGAWVIDYIQDRSYRQGDGRRTIDEAAAAALNQVDQFEKNKLGGKARSRNDGTSTIGEFAHRPAGRFSVAIGIGTLLGLLTLGGVLFFRRQSH